MDKETICNMIINSTWKNHEKSNIYKFITGNMLSINGRNNLQYSVNINIDKIELLMGSEKRYYVEYVNDFTLKLYNNDESFNIMPE